jgi:hypothetical protein
LYFDTWPFGSWYCEVWLGMRGVVFWSIDILLFFLTSFFFNFSHWRFMLHGFYLSRPCDIHRPLHWSMYFILLLYLQCCQIHTFSREFTRIHKFSHFFMKFFYRYGRQKKLKKDYNGLFKKKSLIFPLRGG